MKPICSAMDCYKPIFEVGWLTFVSLNSVMGAKWQKLSAKLIKLALYVLMIGMPLLGWLLVSASGKLIPFFGLELPALVAKNKDLADLVKEIHETGGTIGYFLIGLHAAAALFHHYFVRDNTLRRMLPSRD